MTKQLWACEECNTTYKTAGEAEACEAYHPRYETFRIVGVVWRRLEGVYGPSYSEMQRIPSKVRIRFSDTMSDHALYALESYGPKGV